MPGPVRPESTMDGLRRLRPFADRIRTPPGLLVVPRRDVCCIGTASRRHVENIPERPDRVHVTRVFAFIPAREHKLCRPPVAESVTVPREHVEDRTLPTVRIFSEVVTVIGVVPRGQQPQMAPAALTRERSDPARI